MGFDLSAQMSMFEEYERTKAQAESDGPAGTTEAGAAKAPKKTLERAAKQLISRLRDGTYGAVTVRFEKLAGGSYYVIEERDPRLAILTAYPWVARHLQSIGGVEKSPGVWRVRYEDERCSSLRLKRVFAHCSEILGDLHVLPTPCADDAPGFMERVRQMLGYGPTSAVTHA